MTLRLLLALGLVTLSHGAAAQRVAFSITRGSLEGRGGEYVSRRSIEAGQAALAVTLSKGSLARVVELEVGVPLARKIELSCVKPVGGSNCVPDYPSFTGFSVLGGVRLTARNRADVSLTIGPGYFSEANGRALGFVAKAGVGVRLVGPLGVVAGYRDVRVPNYRDASLGFGGTIIGVQLQ